MFVHVNLKMVLQRKDLGQKQHYSLITQHCKNKILFPWFFVDMDTAFQFLGINVSDIDFKKIIVFTNKATFVWRACGIKRTLNEFFCIFASFKVKTCTEITPYNFSFSSVFYLLCPVVRAGQRSEEFFFSILSVSIFNIEKYIFLNNHTRVNFPFY